MAGLLGIFRETVEVPSVDILTLLFDHENSGARDNSVLHADAAIPGRRITKSQTRNLTKRLAYGLRNEYGIGASGPGKDLVMVCCSGQVFLPVVFYGVIAAGGIYSALSSSATVAELSNQLAQNPSSLLVCSSDTKAVAITAAEKCGLSQMQILVLESSASLNVRNLLTRVNCVSQKEMNWTKITDPTELENSLICLLYSSGTTGPPKGVRLSHTNLVSEAVIPGNMVREKWKEDEAAGEPPFEYRTLAHLPVAHIAGLQGYLVNPFYLGGLVYWMSKFDFPKFLDFNKKYQITLLFSVPAIYLMIAKSSLVTDQLDSLKFAQSGAAPLGPEIQRAASVKIGKGKTFISQTWGLSETTGSATSNLWGPSDDTGSVGLLLPNHSFRLVDDSMQDVAAGESGEIILKGPIVSKGYYNNPKATTDSFRDGWFCTGDIGIFQRELLYIVDRKKELIKYKGYQVAPAELEALLLSHDMIQDAAVIGVEGEGTEFPRAYVVADQSKISVEEIHNFVSKAVATYKQLRGGVVFIDEIPKTASGKILRKDLRQLAARGKLKL